MTDALSAQLGVIVIGRNEGERLAVCLRSVLQTGVAVVYVDSGSTDGSVALARQLGAQVVELDMGTPFTAARARNQGWQQLLKEQPSLQFIQFVDGDCELMPDWLSAALGFLSAHAGYAVVCGRLRERYPQQSIYNQLCDEEWNTPVGDAKACGGIAMMRVGPLVEAGGFRDDLIAGEEPELCVRLRAANWKIYRLDHDMAWHDAAMTRFGQWCRRTMRGGYAYAQGAWLHGRAPERHWVRETFRALLWGAVLPLLIVAMAWLWSPKWLALFLIYPLQWFRLYLKFRHQSVALSRSILILLGKFLEAVGVLRFYSNIIFNRRGSLIEYK